MEYLLKLRAHDIWSRLRLGVGNSKMKNGCQIKTDVDLCSNLPSIRMIGITYLNKIHMVPGVIFFLTKYDVTI